MKHEDDGKQILWKKNVQHQHKDVPLKLWECDITSIYFGMKYQRLFQEWIMKQKKCLGMRIEVQSAFTRQQWD